MGRETSSSLIKEIRETFDFLVPGSHIMQVRKRDREGVYTSYSAGAGDRSVDYFFAIFAECLKITLVGAVVYLMYNGIANPYIPETPPPTHPI